MVIAGCFTILFDIVTGILKAISQHNIDSTMLRQGLFHKLSEILAIAFSIGIEYAIKLTSLNINIPFKSAVCGYIMIMEIVSIMENLSAINPKLGKLYKPYLKKLKENDDGNDKPIGE